MIRAILLLILALLLSSCSSYDKLVKPEAQTISPDLIRAYRTESVRISYKVKGGLNPRDVLDSATAFGIVDVKESEKPEQGRITLIIYPLKSKEDTATRSFYLPWSLVSFVTLYLVPLRMEMISPYEIHVLDPNQIDERKFRIIYSEYASVSWLWLPLSLMSDDPTRLDAGSNAIARVSQTGRRRMMDGVIAEVLKSSARTAE